MYIPHQALTDKGLWDPAKWLWAEKLQKDPSEETHKFPFQVICRGGGVSLLPTATDSGLNVFTQHFMSHLGHVLHQFLARAGTSLSGHRLYWWMMLTLGQASYHVNITTWLPSRLVFINVLSTQTCRLFLKGLICYIAKDKNIYIRSNKW